MDLRHADLLNQAARCRTEADHAAEQLGKPFPHAAVLATARGRVHEIDTAIHTLAAEQHPPTLTGPSPNLGTALAPAIGPPPPQRHHGRR